MVSQKPAESKLNREQSHTAIFYQLAHVSSTFWNHRINTEVKQFVSCCHNRRQPGAWNLEPGTIIQLRLEFRGALRAAHSFDGNGGCGISAGLRHPAALEFIEGHGKDNNRPDDHLLQERRDAEEITAIAQ